jgi:hypothetical protein
VNRSRSGKIKFVVNPPEVVRLRQSIFGEAPIHGLARVLLRLAECFPTGQTEFAVPAGAVQPGNSHPISFLDVLDPRSDCNYNAGAFVSRNKRQCWLDRPITIRRVQVRVADSVRGYLYKHVSRPRCRNRKLSDLQRLTKLFDDRCFHRSRYCFSP